MVIFMHIWHGELVAIMHTTKTTSENQTRQIGRELALALKSEDIVLLSGELGAGKTAFTKGLAEGLGIRAEITSPTFTLMNIYPVHRNEKIKTFVHIDTYRLENEEQLKQIGAEDYLGAPNTICAIEWPEKITGLLKGKKITRVEIKHEKDGTREITIV